MKGIGMQKGVEEDQEGQLPREGGVCFLCCAQPAVELNLITIQ